MARPPRAVVVNKTTEVRKGSLLAARVILHCSCVLCGPFAPWTTVSVFPVISGVPGRKIHNQTPWEHVRGSPRTLVCSTSPRSRPALAARLRRRGRGRHGHRLRVLQRLRDPRHRLRPRLPAARIPASPTSAATATRSSGTPDGTVRAAEEQTMARTLDRGADAGGGLGHQPVPRRRLAPDQRERRHRVRHRHLRGRLPGHRPGPGAGRGRHRRGGRGRRTPHRTGRQRHSAHRVRRRPPRRGRRRGRGRGGPVPRLRHVFITDVPFGAKATDVGVAREVLRFTPTGTPPTAASCTGRGWTARWSAACSTASTPPPASARSAAGWSPPRRAAAWSPAVRAC
ncbi:hypothetical protein SVIOM342S_07754 [Streptomyces violaceorubidus]